MGQTNAFIDTLIAMCLIPNSKAALWSSLPELINRVVAKNEVADLSDLAALKSILDSLHDNDECNPMQEEMEKLKAVNDKLVRENINLKKQKRKWNITKKQEKSKKLQQKMRKNYMYS